MSQSSGAHNCRHSREGGYTAEEYVRRPDHTPQTGQDESEKYILALQTDPAHHKAVTALRTQHFPANINKLSAHVALFRALPGSQLPVIQSAIQHLVHHQEPFPISTGEPFPMTHGVGLHVHAEPAALIFRTLKEQWDGFLSKQDQSFRAHYTIQNKVQSSVAQKSLVEIRSGPHRFEGSTGTVTGLSLYLYDRGYWTLKHTYPFRAEKEADKAHVVDPIDPEEWPSLGAASTPK
ncbi:MAG: hypothetical protein L6R42_004385 [Xanthoria sp. 1 TBL-2021]|nr:MAG: hypothetical protein L6R42_004385 [Xanthoria sp. 1 TBL-2021]